MTRPFSALLKPLTFKTARNAMHVFFFLGFYKFHFHYRNSVALSGMHAYVCLFLFVFIGCQCLGKERKQRYDASGHTMVFDLCQTEAFSFFKPSLYYYSTTLLIYVNYVLVL